jgi:hypothetical protein
VSHPLDVKLLTHALATRSDTAQGSCPFAFFLKKNRSLIFIFFKQKGENKATRSDTTQGSCPFAIFIFFIVTLRWLQSVTSRRGHALLLFLFF